MTRKEKVKSFLCSLLFVTGFLFVGSGMLEGVLLKLMEALEL